MITYYTLLTSTETYTKANWDQIITKKRIKENVMKKAYKKMETVNRKEKPKTHQWIWPKLLNCNVETEWREGSEMFFSTDIDLDTHAWLFLLLESLHHVWLFATLWTAAHYATLSMEFSRQEYWSRLPFPLPEGLPDPGIKHASLALQADSLTLSHQGSPMTILVKYK